MRWRRSTGWATLAGVAALGLAVGLARVSEHQSGRSQVTGPSEAQPTGVATAEARATAVATIAPSWPTPRATRAAAATPAEQAAAGPPWLELDRHTARPGESISLRAGGFLPGEPVRVVLQQGRQTIPLAELLADPAGELVAPALAIPSLKGGGTALVLEGAQSQQTVSRDIAVVGFDPWIVLEEYSLVPGERVGLRGYDFQPGEDVQVWLDGGTQPAHEVQADASGRVYLADLVQVGPADVGRHRLTVTASESGAALDAAYEVRPFAPVMTLTTYAGPPGTTVRFDGHSFAPGETVRVYAERGRQREVVAEFQADEQGAFQEAGAWRVPLDWTAGPVVLAAEGESSQVSHRQTFDVVRQTPWVSVSSASGPTGTRLTVNGAGFGANEEVEILLGNQRIASAVADDVGALANVGPIDLSTEHSGLVQLVVRGQDSGAEAETTFTAE